MGSHTVFSLEYSPPFKKGGTNSLLDHKCAATTCSNRTELVLLVVNSIIPLHLTVLFFLFIPDWVKNIFYPKLCNLDILK